MLRFQSIAFDLRCQGKKLDLISGAYLLSLESEDQKIRGFQPPHLICPPIFQNDNPTIYTSNWRLIQFYNNVYTFFLFYRVCHNEWQGSTVPPFILLSLENGCLLSFIVAVSVKKLIFRERRFRDMARHLNINMNFVSGIDCDKEVINLVVYVFKLKM